MLDAGSDREACAEAGRSTTDHWHSLYMALYAGGRNRQRFSPSSRQGAAPLSAMPTQAGGNAGHESDWMHRSGRRPSCNYLLLLLMRALLARLRPAPRLPPRRLVSRNPLLWARFKPTPPPIAQPPVAVCLAHPAAVARLGFRVRVRPPRSSSPLYSQNLPPPSLATASCAAAGGRRQKAASLCVCIQ
jgi:hypothetical protein